MAGVSCRQVRLAPSSGSGPGVCEACSKPRRQSPPMYTRVQVNRTAPCGVDEVLLERRLFRADGQGAYAGGAMKRAHTAAAIAAGSVCSGHRLRRRFLRASRRQRGRSSLSPPRAHRVGVLFHGRRLCQRRGARCREPGPDLWRRGERVRAGVREADDAGTRRAGFVPEDTGRYDGSTRPSVVGGPMRPLRRGTTTSVCTAHGRPRRPPCHDGVSTLSRRRVTRLGFGTDQTHHSSLWRVCTVGIEVHRVGTTSA